MRNIHTATDANTINTKIKEVDRQLYSLRKEAVAAKRDEDVRLIDAVKSLTLVVSWITADLQHESNE